MFAILKTIAEEGTAITGLGVIEIMQDGFGFLRSSINYRLALMIYMFHHHRLRSLVWEQVIVLKVK